MIRAYPEHPTITRGDDLELRVSTDAREFRVELYRCGASLEPAGDSGPFAGRHVAERLPSDDWQWPRYRVAVPRGARPGVYVAVLVECDRRGRAAREASACAATVDAREARALFVLRPGEDDARLPILYKLPLLTYHAYAEAGGWSFYSYPDRAPRDGRCSAAVSIHRPGGGTGGTPSDVWNRDPFDPTPRQTFAHWDAPFVAWLEGNGYAVDYCTDLDVHRDRDALLHGRRVLLSVGHDEYCSEEMRAGVEVFVARCGNVAFFSGNTCWWCVTFDDEWSFRRARNWCAGRDARPENTLTGVSFRNGGERDGDSHPSPVGLRAQHTDHWAYAGTRLRDGDVFGDGPGEYLVGYECDGASFDRDACVRGSAAVPVCDDGTPEDFVILGVGDARASGWGIGNGAATMGVHGDDDATRSTVFTAATTDWARLLRAGHPAVTTITRNVVDRLSSS